MKLSVLRYAAIGMATLSLAGFAAAATTVTLGTTGPNSSNHVTASNDNDASVSNHNNVGVGNLSDQAAGSGDVTAKDNTTVGGDASMNGSGDASNVNGTTTKVDVTNSGLGADMSMPAPADDSVTFDTTGPNSDNNVKISNDNSLKINNENNIGVFNASSQEAVSGNVKAEDNTTVGGLTSGDASNNNTTETTVSVSN